MRDIHTAYSLYAFSNAAVKNTLAICFGVKRPFTNLLLAFCWLFSNLAPLKPRSPYNLSEFPFDPQSLFQ
jgi:hypothetical protein